MRASSREKAAIRDAQEELAQLSRRQQRLLEEPDGLFADSAPEGYLPPDRRPEYAEPYEYRGNRRNRRQPEDEDFMSLVAELSELGVRTTAWDAFR